MFQEHHDCSFVLEAVSAALSARHPVFRMDRIASIEGACVRINIDHDVVFMDKAPSSALTWHSEDWDFATSRQIAQLAFHVHHDCRLVLDAKQPTRLPGYVETRLRTAVRVRAFWFDYVDHSMLGMLRAKLTARFGRGVVTRFHALAPGKLTARARYIVHPMELVHLAHQPALFPWKVPRRYPSTTTLVGTPATHDVDHVDAGLVCLAVQRTRLVW
jgi:hypothetical protein